MTLQQLKYIVEIYRCGSITEAARRLFIAQPSLSKAVKDLEEEFSITILKRSRHGVSFTEDGIKFLQFSRHILEAEKGMHEFFSANSEDKEELNLSISSQHYMFPVDALLSLVNAMPPSRHYTIRMHEVRTSQVIQDVLTQVSQIGILYVSDMIATYMNRLFEKNDLEFTPFYDFPPYVYLKISHPLAKYSSLTLEQLEPYPYIRYEQGGDPYQFSEEIVIPAVSSKKTVYVTDRSTMFSFLSHTNGYNLGTGCCIPRVVSDTICSIPLNGPFGYMKIGWIKKKNTIMSQAMQEYVH
uniref:LysR family transcriptional regulator n=1 Tax=uncultured Megasphaera sp. TaxID=165188 RepID=UPI00265B0200